MDRRERKGGKETDRERKRGREGRRQRERGREERREGGRERGREEGTEGISHRPHGRGEREMAKLYANSLFPFAAARYGISPPGMGCV